jgi:hypothetical protein
MDQTIKDEVFDALLDIANGYDYHLQLKDLGCKNGKQIWKVIFEERK